MTPAAGITVLEALAAAALAAGIGLVLLACLALLVLRDPWARLHCASLAAIAGPSAVAIGALVHLPPDAGTAFRLVAFALASIAGTGVTTHALARALRLRRSAKVAPR